MKKILVIITALTLSIGMSACSTYDSGPNQTGGTLIGSAAGGLIGAQIGSGSGQLAATAIGALLGAIVGSETGKSLDRSNNNYYYQPRYYQPYYYQPYYYHQHYDDYYTHHYYHY